MAAVYALSRRASLSLVRSVARSVLSQLTTWGAVPSEPTAHLVGDGSANSQSRKILPGLKIPCGSSARLI